MMGASIRPNGVFASEARTHARPRTQDGAQLNIIHNHQQQSVENICSKAFLSGFVVWISGEIVEDLVEKGVDFNQLLML